MDHLPAHFSRAALCFLLFHLRGKYPHIPDTIDRKYICGKDKWFL
jgi:hypothetical protein